MPDFADSYIGRLRKLVGPRLLLVPRLKGNSPTEEQRLRFFGLPGGNAEEGQGLEVAIARETAEETGLEVLDIGPFGFSCDPEVETFTFPNRDQCQYFVLNFFSRSLHGTATVADRCQHEP